MLLAAIVALALALGCATESAGPSAPAVPAPRAQGTLFVEFRNSTADATDLLDHLCGRLRTAGFTIVATPAEADRVVTVELAHADWAADVRSADHVRAGRIAGAVAGAASSLLGGFSAKGEIDPQSAAQAGARMGDNAARGEWDTFIGEATLRVVKRSTGETQQTAIPILVNVPSRDRQRALALLRDQVAGSVVSELQ